MYIAKLSHNSILFKLMFCKKYVYIYRETICCRYLTHRLKDIIVPT